MPGRYASSTHDRWGTGGSRLGRIARTIVYTCSGLAVVALCAIMVSRVYTTSQVTRDVSCEAMGTCQAMSRVEAAEASKRTPMTAEFLDVNRNRQDVTNRTTNVDPDGDKVVHDNCPHDYNPDQIDKDGDTFGYATVTTCDCDDCRADVNPSMTEIPNDFIDNNCDGRIDETNDKVYRCIGIADCPQDYTLRRQNITTSCEMTPSYRFKVCVYRVNVAPRLETCGRVYVDPVTEAPFCLGACSKESRACCQLDIEPNGVATCKCALLPTVTTCTTPQCMCGGTPPVIDYASSPLQMTCTGSCSDSSDSALCVPRKDAFQCACAENVSVTPVAISPAPTTGQCRVNDEAACVDHLTSEPCVLTSRCTASGVCENIYDTTVAYNATVASRFAYKNALETYARWLVTFEALVTHFYAETTSVAPQVPLGRLVTLNARTQTLARWLHQTRENVAPLLNHCFTEFTCASFLESYATLTLTNDLLQSLFDTLQITTPHQFILPSITTLRHWPPRDNACWYGVMAFEERCSANETRDTANYDGWVQRVHTIEALDERGRLTFTHIEVLPLARNMATDAQLVLNLVTPHLLSVHNHFTSEAFADDITTAPNAHHDAIIVDDTTLEIAVAPCSTARAVIVVSLSQYEATVPTDDSVTSHYAWRLASPTGTSALPLVSNTSLILNTQEVTCGATHSYVAAIAVEDAAFRWPVAGASMRDAYGAPFERALDAWLQGVYPRDAWWAVADKSRVVARCDVVE